MDLVGFLQVDRAEGMRSRCNLHFNKKQDTSGKKNKRAFLASADLVDGLFVFFVDDAAFYFERGCHLAFVDGEFAGK